MQYLTEGIIDRLKAYFEEHIEGKVNAVNQEHGDTLLETPLAFFYGARPLNAGNNYPEVSIWATDMDVIRYDRTFTDASHDVSMAVAIEDQDTEVLQRSMYRYGKVMWELLTDRFFTTTGDDYFALHGDGDIHIEYEKPDGETSGPPYKGRVTLTATFEKQED